MCACISVYMSDACRFVFECLSGVRQEGMCGAVLADGMGLGKTFQTIASLYCLLTKGIFNQPTCKKPLILCPTSLVQVRRVVWGLFVCAHAFQAACLSRAACRGHPPACNASMLTCALCADLHACDRTGARSWSSGSETGWSRWWWTTPRQTRSRSHCRYTHHVAACVAQVNLLPGPAVLQTLPVCCILTTQTASR